MKKLEFLIIILFCMALTSRAQDSNSLLKQIQAEDQVGIEALTYTINQTEPNRPRQLPNLNQAPEYHKRTWEKTRPTVVRPVPQNKMQNKGTLIKKPIKRN